MTLSLADPVKRVADALEGAQFALVFGSFGTPGFGPESDLDVAVSFRRALPPMDLVSLAGRLETAAGRRVDVVDLRRADSERRSRRSALSRASCPVARKSGCGWT